jgi:hypothetical protein
MHEGRRKKFQRKARRAAAYAKTPVRWTPSIPTILSLVFAIEFLSILLWPELKDNRAFVLFVGLSIPIGAWLFVYWKIYLSVSQVDFPAPLRSLVVSLSLVPLIHTRSTVSALSTAPRTLSSTWISLTSSAMHLAPTRPPLFRPQSSA